MYLFSGNIFRLHGVVFIIRTLIIMSEVIPISMKVNIEFSKLIYGKEIVKNSKNSNIIIRNSSIPEELGRI